MIAAAFIIGGFILIASDQLDYRRAMGVAIVFITMLVHLL